MKVTKTRQRPRPLTVRQELLFFGTTFGMGLLLQLAVTLKLIALIP